MTSGWRLGVLGIAFLALFGLLTLRMWQIQITEAAEYTERAERNKIAVAPTPAPRGDIVDRNGELFAGTRPVFAAVVDAQLLYDDDLPELVSRLAAFTGSPAEDVQHFIEDVAARGDRIAILTELTEAQALFLKEHQEDFPAVTVERQPVRIYPQGELAASILGYIGKPDEADIEAGAASTDLLGRAGLERRYDDLLQGTPGVIKYEVDAQREGQKILGEQKPSAGNTLTLTIDGELQRVVRESLAEGLQVARNEYDPDCIPGEKGDPRCPVRAVGVVLEVNTGAVLAMESVPTYDPNSFIGGLTQDELDALPEGALSNFAIQGEYAPASTFKAVTYVTAYEEGIAPISANSVEEQIQCSETLRAPFIGDASRQVWNNWTRGDDGLQDIHRAFMRSCNVYFWEIALRIWDENKNTNRENLLQDWAYSLGFGAETNIDLPFERPGIVPDRSLFLLWKSESPQRLDPARLELASPWLGGDLLQAAVGQGAVTVTPLQLANAYAAMVNGGKLWQPYLVDQVEDVNGNLVQDFEPTLLREVPIDPTTVLSLRRDMQQVVNGPGGTANAAFAEFGNNVTKVGGKTGTAEVIKDAEPETPGAQEVDTALFAGVAPIDDPEYVVVVVIERGGSGGAIAAPTARRILQYLLNGPAAVTPIDLGEVTD
jgi:penicillin-binding protein 2